MLQTDINERFCFRARNQDTFADVEVAGIKFLSPGDVCQGFAIGAAFDKIPHANAFVVRKWHLEIRVQLDPLTVACVRQQEFRRQTWGLDFFLFQKPGGPLQNSLHGPHIIRGCCRIGHDTEGVVKAVAARQCSRCGEFQRSGNRRVNRAEPVKRGPSVAPVTLQSLLPVEFHKTIDQLGHFPDDDAVQFVDC